MKQIGISLIVLVAGLLLWVWLFAGAGAVLARYGVADPFVKIGLIAAPGADDAPQAGRKAPGQNGGQTGGPPGAKGPPRTVTVVVEPAGREVLNDKVSALGTGIARHSVTVVPQSDGRLTEVLIRSGAQVAMGEVIARLDARDEEIAYEKAKLAADDAQRTLERNKQLVQSNAVPASQSQAVELAARVADLTLRTATQDLAERSITAPIAGEVGILDVTVGNEVTPQTVIATIEDSSVILVNFWLPERLVRSVHPGDTATLVPVARPQDSLAAEVTAIDNRIDSSSGTFKLQAEAQNPDGALRPGMAFTVSLQFPGESFATVDPLAVQWGSQGAFVWRIRDDKAEKVPVQIVQRNTESVLVAGEVAEGDAIVTEGLDGLKPGAEVRIQGETPPGDTAPISN